MKTAKLKLQSDGTSSGTILYVEDEAGERTEIYFSAIEWKLDGGGHATAKITIPDIDTAIEWDAETFRKIKEKEHKLREAIARGVPATIHLKPLGGGDEDTIPGTFRAFHPLELIGKE